MNLQISTTPKHMTGDGDLEKQYGRLTHKHTQWNDSLLY